MAKKKETIESISKRISDLGECEQTPETVKEIDELKVKLEGMKKTDIYPFTRFEKWRMEKVLIPIMDGKTQRTDAIGNKLFDVEFKREKLIKTCVMLQEHANTLNEQTINTLFEYVKKEE